MRHVSHYWGKISYGAADAYTSEIAWCIHILSPSLSDILLEFLLIFLLFLFAKMAINIITNMACADAMWGF